MSIRRIFIGQSKISHQQALITDPEILHRLSKVLRLRMHDQVRIFDVQNKEYLAQISEINKKIIKLEIQKKLPNILFPKPETWLYQALTKPMSKFETVLQKGTELGTNGFVPIITAHTETKSLGKEERLENIIIGASEQCGRSDIPKLNQTQNFAEILANPPQGANILTYENESEKTLADILPELKNSEKINIFIGPEGGWEEQEIRQAQEQNFQIIGLGEVILRTETVAPALLAAIRLS